ncbi:DsbA family protein [Pontibacter sp. SGAir0037]|uniref:DsbA family protein n=1 Tax=Pontibacter sp. SGAir0037 TaxID=2571030 RepID=UPI0010CCF197|nr:DsbA family protein [Pontibacter sp. SGAir0037]QCR24937.1 DsbA family protein [Pontibacter sp. SGAir0037]
MNELQQKPHLIYVMDPMCSWCYGFAPIINQVKQEQEKQLGFKLVMGGLRPGTNSTLEEASKASMKQHWLDVAQVTAQPFDYNFFERSDFVYDTEPASRAVVTMRYMKPEAEFAFAKAIQHAFYAQNQDITKTEVLLEIATRFGVDQTVFIASFASEEAKEKTAQDFLIARQLQANAFPSLYLLSTAKVFLINRGYSLYEAVSSRLTEALQKLF